MCSLFSFFPLNNQLSSPSWTTMWLELTWSEESWYPGTCVGFSEGRCTRCCYQAHAKVNWGTCRGYVGFVGLERGWAAAKNKQQEWEGVIGMHIYPVSWIQLQILHEEVSYPGGRILQDVGFQLLHEHLVIEDNNGVIVALSDQHMLEGLQHTVTQQKSIY